MTIALSPVRRKLQTAASIPTVPEPAISSGSCLVWSSQRRPSCTSRRHSVNGGRPVVEHRAAPSRGAPAPGPESGQRSADTLSWHALRRLDGGSCSITTCAQPTISRSRRSAAHRMSLAQFADASFGYPGTEILDRRLAADPSGRAPGAGGAERHRQVDRAAPARGRPRSRTRATCACSGAPASPTCASRRSCRARARCSTRCSSRSPSCSGCTSSSSPPRPSCDDGDPATLARYGELQERYQREGGYELEARVKRLIADVGFTEADLARSVDTLSGGERGRLELAKVLVQTAGSAAARRADQPPRPRRDRAARELPRRVHRARSCSCRTIAPSSARCAARSSSSRTASSSATRSATTSTSSSATRASNARAPRTSARRSTSRRPRTSSAATSPDRRRSRRRAGARCWRSWTGSSAPTTSGSTRARSPSSSRPAAIWAARRRSARPSSRVGYPGGRRSCATSPRTSTAATRSASSGRTAAASRRCSRR